MPYNSRMRVVAGCGLIVGFLAVNPISPARYAKVGSAVSSAQERNPYDHNNVSAAEERDSASLAAKPLQRARQTAMREIKVIPVRWCLVDDGMNPHGAPSGRFSAANRLAALLLKSLIWSQVGILFVPQGRPVVIDDPNPPPAGPGARGDLLGVPNVPSAELTAARAACNKKIGRDAREKIVDIVARRFVNPAGAPTGLNGRTAVVDECKLNTLPDKPVVKDPDAYNFFFRCVNAGANGSFVRTLAHENGHALSLRHPNPMPVGRLMSQTWVTNGCTLTAAEGAQARREADRKLSGVRKKNKRGRIVQESKPRTRIAVDDVGDVPQSWVDIVEAIAVRRPDRALGLEMYLAGLVPPNTQGLKYVFMVDVDNDPATGGSPDVGFQHRAQGIDLVAEISVSIGSTRELHSVTVKVRRFRRGRFVELADKRIEAALVTVREADDVNDQTDAQAEFQSFDVVKFVLPPDLLPRPLAENFRVSSFAFDSRTGALDEAPIVEGSVTNFPEPALIQLSPLDGPVGTRVVVTGVSFTPNSEVEIFLGKAAVAKAIADNKGYFRAQFTVPPPTEETSIEDVEGGTVSPVTAVDSAFVSDAMIFALTASSKVGPSRGRRRARH
jgi:hypothetical protein